MKQGTAVIRIVIFVLLAAVLVYLGVYLWQGLSDPYQLVVTYSYEMDDDVAISGVMVRAEEVIPGQAALAEVLPQEGERVAAGAAVAVIYQDESALSDRHRAKAVEQELEQLRYAMGLGDSQSDAKTLDSQLVADLAALRTAVSTGSLDELEDRGLDIRSVVVKRTVQAGNQSGVQLQAAAAQLESELAALNAVSARTTRRVTVSHGGVFSGLADGYEALLTPETLETLTVGELDALRQRETNPPADSLGKLITDASWYFVCPMAESDARRLTEGGSVTVRFSRDWSGEVDMTVERISVPEEGRVAVILSSHKFLSATTLLRRQTVELVFDRRPGLQVPAQALRVEERTWKDDAGTEHTDQTSCVYVLVGIKAERKWVNILAQGEDYYLVEPITTKKDTESQEKRYLRAGDQVIVATQEIYDGMIVG